MKKDTANGAMTVALKNAFAVMDKVPGNCSGSGVNVRSVNPAASPPQFFHMKLLTFFI
jgi:hypothetical protein